MTSKKWTEDDVSVLSRYSDLMKESFTQVLMGRTAVYTERDNNEAQAIQNMRRRALVHALYKRSGFIERTTYQVDSNNPATLTFDAKQVLNVAGHLVLLPPSLDVVLAENPESGTRNDLVFFEVFEKEVVYDNSSPEHGVIGRPSNPSFEDPRATNLGKDQTSRVALIVRPMVASDVDFQNYPKGLNDTAKVTAQGGADEPTEYTYTYSSEQGVYVAGNGDEASRQALKTIDGYVYAIPVLRAVHETNAITFADLRDNIMVENANVEEAKRYAESYTDEQIQLVSATGIPKLVTYQYESVATHTGQTIVTIPLDTYDHVNDTLRVRVNRAPLNPTDYGVTPAQRDEEGQIITLGNINLNPSRSLTEGDVVVIDVFKNVPIGEEGAINGAVMAVDSIPYNRVKSIGDLESMPTESKVIAEAIAEVFQAYVDLTNAAPAALDTLYELANALGDDPNFATTVTNLIAEKVDKTSYTAADVLAKLLTVDGAGSGVDADLLDGRQGSYFTNAIFDGNTNLDPNTTEQPYILTNHANSPTTSAYWHILTLRYYTGNRSQIAVTYNETTPRMFIRQFFSEWTAWNELLPVSGGTMSGALVAQNNTQYTTKQVRNVIMSTNDPTGGNSGDIWIKYKE